MSKNKNLWSVYKLTSPSGKVYIGSTKDVKHRWRGNGNGYKGNTSVWDAIQKYGWEHFDHEIVASGLSEEDAWQLESDLVADHDAMNPLKGYNLTTGGRHGKLSQESIERLRASQMDHPVSDKVRKILSEYNRIPIICIETNRVYDSAVDASNDLGLCCSSIRKAAKGKQDTCGGLHFATLSDYENDCVKHFTFSPSIYNRVRCITTGEVFDNVSDASRKTGLSRRAISYACNGIHKTCGGMEWEFCSDD